MQENFSCEYIERIFQSMTEYKGCKFTVLIDRIDEKYFIFMNDIMTFFQFLKTCQSVIPLTNHQFASAPRTNPFFASSA